MRSIWLHLLSEDISDVLRALIKHRKTDEPTCAFQSCCVLNNRVRFCHKTSTSGIRCFKSTLEVARIIFRARRMSGVVKRSHSEAPGTRQEKSHWRLALTVQTHVTKLSGSLRHAPHTFKGMTKQTGNFCSTSWAIKAFCNQ